MDMKMLRQTKELIVLFILCCFCESNIADNADNGGQLAFVHILFRHGDRTPIDFYPNDPWQNETYWDNVLPGQLTNDGKRQHFELGGWLREKYGNLISDNYSPNEIYVSSTDVDRALMSALSNLAGFYTPKGRDIWNLDILWEPIPVHTVPSNMDYVLYSGKPCARYDYLYRKYKESETHKQLKKKYKKVFDYMTEHSGKPVNSFKTAQQMYSCLYIEHIHNKTLPDWTQSIFPYPLSEISAISFETITATREMARLKSGPLLKDMLNRFDEKVKHKLTPNRSIWYYSAHDTTVGNLMNALKLFDPPFNPPFTALVLMELRIRDNIPYVSIIYKNGTSDKTGKQLTIPNCGVQCPLQKMFTLYEDVLINNFDDECHLNTLSLSYEDAEVGNGIVPVSLLSCSVALVIILLILLALSATTLYRRRNYQDPRWYLRVDS